MIELFYEAIYILPIGLFMLSISSGPEPVRVAVCAMIVSQFLLNTKCFRYLVAGAFVAYLASSVIVGFDLSPWTIIISMFFVLVLLAEIISKNWLRVGSDNIKGSMVFLMPFILAIVLGVRFLPAPDKPYDWQFFIDAYTKTKNTIVAFIEYGPWGNDGNSEALIGFSEDATLQAGLKGENQRVMTISVENSSINQVYLAGKTYDSFDGHSWDNTYKSVGKDSLIDSLQTIGAINGYCDDHTEDYYQKVKLNVKYDMMRTHVVFAPTKTFWDSATLASIGAKSIDGNEEFSKNKGSGTEYRIQYLVLNQDRDFFEEFLEQSNPASEDWNMTIQKSHFSKIDGLSEEDVEEYSNRLEVYRKPVKLSDDVQSYLDEITSGADSDYEKLKRLESVLGEMEYTLSPGKMSEKVDSDTEFLDYFLLENPKGYCSYYATTFVLLSRSMGIPARFVQGYRVPIPNGFQEDVIVSSDMAHAWPEAYIKGVGWISFEPTPGYKKEQKWHTYEEKRVDVAQSNSKDLGEYYKKQTTAGFEISEGLIDLEPQKVDLKHVISVGLKVAAGIIATGIIVVLMSLIFERIQYLRLPEIEKKKISYRKKLGKMKKYKAAYIEGETLEEYRCRVRNQVPEGELDFISEYERLLYGPSGN